MRSCPFVVLVVICMPFASSFHICFLLSWSWVRKFRNLIECNLLSFPKGCTDFTLFYIYESVGRKTPYKKLMVIMRSYVYKYNKDKPWKFLVKKAILVTLQTYRLRSIIWNFEKWNKMQRSSSEYSSKEKKW